MEHASDPRDEDQTPRENEVHDPKPPVTAQAALQDRAHSEAHTEQERRQRERRHLDRRTTLTMGGRRYQEDRRRHDRRVRLAGAGLLAAAAFAVGGHEIASRMGVPSLFAPPSEPSASVDVATDFHLPTWDKAALEPFIQEAATTHGMSADLIRAVIQTESRFNPLAVSRVGAQGLMQLMPATAKHVGIENPFDPRENILGGTKYLSTLLDRFKGNTARALAAYNAGPTVVARHSGLPPFRETQGYVRKIQKLVDNTDAEFTLPASAKVRQVALRRHSAARSSAKSAASRSKTKRHTTVKKASVRTTRRASAL
jgi:transglycosylase-like protein with SLT domain